jgi:hypothetical protein
MPEYSRRLKTHLILHIVDSILDFGPTQGYNTERFESFNSLVRTQNIFGNRQSPSRDIAFRFAVLQNLRYICSGGYFSGKQCGEELRHLYQSSEVQSFLNGTPSSKTLHMKEIYQDGCLRKLYHGTKYCALLDIICDEIPLKDLLVSYLLNGLPDDVTLYSKVLVHHGVMSCRKQLVNIGDFVKVTSSNVKYGVLLSCMKLEKDDSSVCIVRELKEQYNNGHVSLNEFECPLLTLTMDLFVIPSTSVYSSISVPHICTSSCTFTSDFTSYNHNFSNLSFCYNIYCMNN